MALQDLLETVRKFGPPAGEKILLAVSGGRDSMVLWYCLRELAEHDIYIFHMDHRLREDSNEDFMCIQNYAQEYETTYCERVDIAVHARRHRLSIEEAARNVRYKCLKKYAQENEIQWIVTAHHRDDQAETVLANVLRGASAQGAAGMPIVRPLDNMFLVRPFLQHDRQELREIAEELQIPWREDYTNQDTTINRNKIRHIILPEFEEHVPGFTEALLAWSDTQRDIYLKRRARIRAVLQDWHEKGRIELAECLEWPRDDRWQLWRAVLVRCGAPIERKQMRRLDRIAQQQQGAQLAYKEGGCCAKDDLLWFIRGKQAIQDRPSAQDLPVPGQINTELRHFQTQVLSRQPDEIPDGKERVLLNFEACRGQLRLRPLLGAERWQPLGLQGHQRVRKTCREHGLPAPIRDTVLIVADDEGVLWVPGVSIAERVRVDESHGSFVLIERNLL